MIFIVSISHRGFQQASVYIISAMKCVIMFLCIFTTENDFLQGNLSKISLISYGSRSFHSVCLSLILSSANILQLTAHWSFGLSAAFLHLLPIYLFTFSLWRHISELSLPPQDFIVNCSEECRLQQQLFFNVVGI